MMKVIGAVLVSALLLVFLVGCGGNEQAEAGGQGQSTSEHPEGEHPASEETKTEEAEHPEGEHPASEESKTE